MFHSLYYLQKAHSSRRQRKVVQTGGGGNSAHTVSPAETISWYYERFFFLQSYCFFSNKEFFACICWLIPVEVFCSPSHFLPFYFFSVVLLLFLSSSSSLDKNFYSPLLSFNYSLYFQSFPAFSLFKLGMFFFLGFPFSIFFSLNFFVSLSSFKTF
jgi:hypothetical protein